jgi:hypothetical protein
MEEDEFRGWVLETIETIEVTRTTDHQQPIGE